MPVTIFYIKSFQSRVSNFQARVSTWTSWAESSSSATKVVSARFHEMHCAQDCAQDFAQVNYAYLSAKWWIHIDTVVLNSALRSMLHLGCKCNLKVIFLHEASKSMKVPAEINNLASQGYWNHDSGGKKQQSSSQSHENQDNPNRNQQSSFAEPPASQQFQQISTILHLQRPRPRPSQLHIPISKTMNPYRHHDAESSPAQGSWNHKAPKNMTVREEINNLAS